MSVLSPLNVKRFDKTHSIYINHTHLIHFFYTFQFVSILYVKSKILFLSNWKPRTHKTFIKVHQWLPHVQSKLPAQAVPFLSPRHDYSIWILRSSEWISSGLRIPKEERDEFGIFNNSPGDVPLLWYVECVGTRVFHKSPIEFWQ